MKNFKYLLCLIPILIFAYITNAGEIQNYAFPFIGKWNCTEDPMLIDDYGFQDVQNVRKDGKHFKTVDGHTKINGTALTSFPYIFNGYHFRKDRKPAESHVIVYTGNTIPGSVSSARLFENETAIPSTGNFTATAIYTPSNVTDPYVFSSAPENNMIASNWGDETLIWGGDEQPITAFFTSSADITYELTNPYDYSEMLSDYSSNAANVYALISANTSTDAYYKLLAYFNGSDGANTGSTNTSQTITFYGTAQLDTADKKFGTASLLLGGGFNGTYSANYVSVPDSTNWSFGTDDFTIDTWFKYSSSGAYICGQLSSDTVGWEYLIDSANALQFAVYNGTATALYYTGSNATTPGQWQYLQLSRHGSDIKMYIDGVSQTLTESVAIGTQSMPDIASPLYIGAQPVSEMYYTTTGWIDSLRISKGIARDGSLPTAETESTGSNYFLIGYKRPIKGVRFYVKSGNTSTSTFSGYQWTGSAWSSLSGAGWSDGCSNGSRGLNVTDGCNVTFTSTTSTAQPRYFNGYSLYWYKFALSAGSASLYYVTVDAPIQSVKNIWDGAEIQAVKIKKYDASSYTDYTNVWNNSDMNNICKNNPADKRCTADDYIDLLGDNNDSTFANVSSLPNTYSLLLGFTQPMQGFDLRFVPAMVNANVTTMTVKYWTGQAWSTVSALSDGTSAASKSFNKNGVVVFSPVTSEFKKQISDNNQLYYYMMSFSNTLSNAVEISELRGIPVPETLSRYRFAKNFQNRLFLCNDRLGERNKCIYSAYETADIFNGQDSGVLTFGDNKNLVAAAPIYNVFNTTGGIEQLIITKNNETYRLTGSNPETWTIQRLSGNIGCVAPLTMVSADSTSVDGVRKQVAIWMNDKGVYMTDGSTVQSISDDIQAYFDPANSKYIPTNMMQYSYGWYDPNLKSYKLLVASGSGANAINTELEYSLKYNEWTKIYREHSSGQNPLQSGFMVSDTNGKTYSYGGDSHGYMYRLENGNNWDGLANITSYLWTKEIILDQQKPLFRPATVKHMRTLHKKKATGIITLTHYGDGTATTSGSGGQVGPANITAANAANATYDTQSVLLGPNITHSFKYSVASNVAGGMELLGLGIWYEPYDAIRQ